MLSRMSRFALRLPRTACTPVARPAVAVRMFSATALSAALFSVQGSERPGSILREAAPGLQKQPYTLLFVSDGDRQAWQPWIGYFTSAGYDCIDLALNAESSDERANEVAGQIRVASLQREPVIFIKGPTDEMLKVYLGTGGWLSRRGPGSGMVLIHPSSDAARDAAWPSRMPVIMVPRSDSDARAWEAVLEGKTGHIVRGTHPEAVLKEIERVMREVGL